MNKYVSLFVLTSVFIGNAAVMESCKHEPPDLPPGGDEPVVSDDCDPDTVYFQNDVLPILVSNCAMSGCHNAESAEDGVVLDNYTDVFVTGEVSPGNPGESELYEVLVETDPDKIMPPPPTTLSSQDIQIIETWILQGALNNECKECDTLNITYSTHVGEIVQTNCQGCHSGATPLGNLALETYDQVKVAVNNRGLLNRIRREAGEIGVMPQAGPMVDCNIRTIEIWVDNGMPQ
jgi:hypothetical protein